MALTTLRQVARGARSAALVALVALHGALPGAAQYPGRTQKQDAKKAPPPRAVSVLEWVGAPGKPVASRIVPVAVFVNGGYQDGGLYLAQPAPLTVETDTLYELEQAGVPKGSFEVAGGQNIGGAWFGYGQWKPLDAPKPPKKLTPSKTLPKVIEDNDPDRPRFKGGDAAGGPGQASGAKTPPAPASDPDKPTLHRRTDAGGGGSDGPASAPAADDPDRPHLKKRTEAAAKAGSPDEEASPVSSVNEADPDRPRLSRDKAPTAGVAMEATRLTGMPADLQQMAAVSDPAVREQHNFSYPWPNPEDAAKMQAAMEALAIKTVLAKGAPGTSTPVAGSGTAHPVARSGARRAIAMRGAPAKAAPVALSEEDFHAYELSYNAGATLVFSTKAVVGTANPGSTEEKYVTIIAQPDFNGDPQLRFQAVTDVKHFDITPRMRLVDAVDTDGDNRAELVFELRHASDRQFAIYRLTGSRAELAFATESQPYGIPNHVETQNN